MKSYMQNQDTGKGTSSLVPGGLRRFRTALPQPKVEGRDKTSAFF
jgi:hypothetical protein